MYFFSFHQPPLLGLSWYIVISLSHTHGLVLFSMFFWIVVYEGLSCLGFLEVFFHVNETTFLLVSFINWIMKNEQWLHVVCYLKRVILLENEIKNHVYGHTHTITIIPTLVSSSKAKPRRKQEETVQRFNRISCIGRATLDQSFPFPHLFLSFPPSPSVLLFLCYWILVSLPERGECVGLVNGITGNIWTYRWQSVFERIVGRQNNFYR